MRKTVTCEGTHVSALPLPDSY